MDKCFHGPNRTFLLSPSVPQTLSEKCFGLTRPSSGVVTISKIVALSLQFSRVWNTFNKIPVKFIKCWYLLIASIAHCQLCMLCFFGGVFMSLLVELFWLCVCVCVRQKEKERPKHDIVGECT
jgi:hypothetical protein